MSNKTYESDLNLNLGNVPRIENDENDVLYNELLDIHNALEMLASRTGGGDDHGCACIKLPTVEDCLQWAPANDPAFVRIWAGGVNQAGYSGYETAIKYNNVLAVFNDDIYQVVFDSVSTWAYNSLVHSNDDGATWTPVLDPYDSQWELWRGSPIPQYPNTMGFTSIRFIAGKFYGSYAYTTLATVFSAVSDPPTAQSSWNIEHTVYKNNTYTPSRNNCGFGIDQFSYYLGEYAATFLISGTLRGASQWTTIAIQRGPAEAITPPNSRAANVQILYQDLDPGGSTRNADGYQCASVNGFYFATAGAGDVILYFGQTEIGAGTRVAGNTYLSGSNYWETTGTSGSYGSSDSYGSYTSAGGVINEDTDIPWVVGDTYILAPKDGYDNPASVNFGKYVNIASNTDNATSPSPIPTEHDYSQYLIAEHPDDDQSKLQIFALGKTDSYSQGYLIWYAFRETVSDLTKRIYIRKTKHLISGVPSEPAIIEFPAGEHYAYGAQSNGGGVFQYSATTRKLYFSTVAYTGSSTQQAIYAVEDPFVCILGEESYVTPNNGDILVYDEAEDVWVPTAQN